MDKPLVSIITPCYNGEIYVKRFLDSVLGQTYSNIEFIFVNDGSTDKTEDIVLSYKKRFEDRGIRFIYIYQENKGVAAALNQGLKIFQGEYLTWPDSDDILHKDNITKKVSFLENNPKYGFVLCRTQCVSEQNVNIKLGVLERKTTNSDKLFLDLIMESNVYFAPGGYMVRTIAFLDVKADRKIYESENGQNWQMLLPLAYKYRCGYLKDILYYYVVRADSHSRREKDYTALLKKTYGHEDLLKTVVNEMQISERDYYQNIIKIKYIKKRLLLACQFREIDFLKQQYALLKNCNALDFQSKIYYRMGLCGLPYAIFKIAHRLFTVFARF